MVRLKSDHSTKNTVSEHQNLLRKDFKKRRYQALQLLHHILTVQH